MYLSAISFEAFRISSLASLGNARRARSTSLRPSTYASVIATGELLDDGGEEVRRIREDFLDGST
jgi:hypothetical protein